MHLCPSLTCGHAGGTVYIVGGRYTDGGLLNLPGQADLVPQPPASETLAPQDASGKAGTDS